MLSLEQLRKLKLDRAAIERVPESVAREYCVLPVGFENGKLTLVLPNELDERTYELLTRVLEFEFDYLTAEPVILRGFVNLHYSAVYSDVRNCSPKFRVTCPKMWINLDATSNPLVRHCVACQQSVYYCDSIEEFNEHRGRGHCVAYVDRPTSAATLGLPM